MKLSDREEWIVLATIKLYNVNKKHGCVPDYELIENPFHLSAEEMREIRDLIQDLVISGK